MRLFPGLEPIILKKKSCSALKVEIRKSDQNDKRWKYFDSNMRIS
jgi:hypothetical protein